ncbi:uncharacterized protein YukE [Stackebrandtia albiflava]|uniref:Uncharacterized protein YukE n=1 Tax=Stackebrandtia albiflava TaxID=406432 RepID=A0A562URW0_9ACTN|nr:WXG100 family type VII secretion target [Stackebrandtia albiflava]TWJ08365.1 uncharacterized protein YukE [Stackebrandtia albiflava]
MTDAVIGQNWQGMGGMASSYLASADELDAELKALYGKLQEMGWKGADQQSFTDLQTAWDRDAKQMNEALRELAGKINATVASKQALVGDIAKTFNYTRG